MSFTMPPRLALQGRGSGGMVLSSDSLRRRCAMPLPAPLDAIARGAASPAEARAALAESLKDTSPETARQVYTALRAWTWKALDGQRRDDELREWFDLLKRAESHLSDHYPAIAQRLQVLHELVYESISVAEVHAPTQGMRP